VEIKEEEIIEELKQNFFESRGTNSTKGKFGEDVLANQSIKNKQKLSDNEINDLLASNELARIVLEAPVLDTFKNGLTVKVTDSKGMIIEKQTSKLNKRLEELEFLRKLQELLISSRRYGFATMFMAVKEKVGKTTSSPLSDNYTILGFNIITKDNIRSISKNTDVLDPKFNEVTELRITPKRRAQAEHRVLETAVFSTAKLDFVRDQEAIIHPSRMIFSEEFAKPGELGMSIFQQLYDRFVIFDTVEWSIGQLIYRINFLVYSTSKQNAEGLSKRGISHMEQEINSSTLAVIGKDDELKSVDTSRGVDPEQYINGAGTILSIHTNIPKQRLIGNSSGAIAGAKEDAKKYSEYLKRLFTAKISRIATDMVNKVAKEQGIKGNIIVELPELTEMDSKENAELQLLNGQIVEQNLKLLRDTVTFLKVNWYMPTKESLVNALEMATSYTLLDSTQLVPLLKDSAEQLQDVDYMLKQINIIQNIRNLGFGNKVDVRKLIKSLEDDVTPLDFEELLKILGDSEFAMPGSIDTAGTQDKGITNNNDNAQNRVDSLAQAINGTNSNNSVQVNKKVATTANKKPSSISAEVDNDPGNLGSAR
jgi:phage-related protein (TIGR01555 family)